MRVDKYIYIIGIFGKDFDLWLMIVKVFVFLYCYNNWFFEALMLYCIFVIGMYEVGEESREVENG